MSTIEIQNVNPVGLVAVVTPIVGGGYSVKLSYGTTTNVTTLFDDFDSMPSTVTINVTSSTVPSGYHLEASGDGTWTTVSASSLSGSFAGSGEESSVEYSFTILLVSDSSEVVARHDPRVVLRKIGGF